MSRTCLSPIEYCSKLNNKDATMVQMYWTQTSYLIYTELSPEDGMAVIQGRSTIVCKKKRESGLSFMHTHQFSLHHKVIIEVNIPVVVY